MVPGKKAIVFSRAPKLIALLLPFAACVPAESEPQAQTRSDGRAVEATTTDYQAANRICAGLGEKRAGDTVSRLDFVTLYSSSANCEVVLGSEVCDTWLIGGPSHDVCSGPYGLSSYPIFDEWGVLRRVEAKIGGQQAKSAWVLRGRMGEAALFENRQGVSIYYFSSPDDIFEETARLSGRIAELTW